MLRAEKDAALFSNLPALAREAMAASLCPTPALTSNVHPNPLNLSAVRRRIALQSRLCEDRPENQAPRLVGPPAAGLLNEEPIVLPTASF